MRKFRPLLLIVTAVLVLARGASGALVTYGFVGTTGLLTPYDPDDVLVLAIEPAMTPLSGTFTVDDIFVVPEPTTAGLATLVAAALPASRRRRDTANPRHRVAPRKGGAGVGACDLKV